MSEEKPALSHKPDEVEFWRRIQSEVGRGGSRGKTPREIISEPGFPMNHKRAWGLLEKWADRGWYEYGVCLDLGWITEKGETI